MKQPWTAILLLASLTSIEPSSASAQHDAREMYLDGREHLLDERFEEALATFRRIVVELPASDEADDAQYYVGYTLAELGRYHQAIDAYSELLDRWPDSVRVERARARRAQLLARVQGPTESEVLLDEIFDTSSSWQLKRDTAYAMARKGNLAAADVLAEAMERESTSRQIELARILAPLASDPAARRILIQGLGSARSTSVSLRALQSLEPVASQEDVADAIGRLLANESSSSVKLQAVRVLQSHLDTEASRRAMSAALEPDNSSSVQLAACSALAGRLLEPEVRPTVLRVFRGPTSSSVQLRCLASLESDKNDDDAADVLREAISQRESSTSVRLRALQIAGSSDSPAVRAVAEAGLDRALSTTVQLQALRAIAAKRNDEDAAEALDGLFQTANVSTSVLIAAIDALAGHMDTASGPRALGHALSGPSSTSVQLKALKLASEHLDEVEVKEAVLTILARSDTSTSVQLEAVSMLGTQMVDADVRRIVGAALRPSSSTSVSLRAVEELGATTQHADSRAALARALDDDFSTSVVLSAMEALEPHVDDDSVVRDAFVRVMESRDVSSTARVRAAERLAPGADGNLSARIADAMEDVILRMQPPGGRDGRGHRDLIEDALDVLEDVDPARAERLRSRSRSGAGVEPHIIVDASTWPMWPNPMM